MLDRGAATAAESDRRLGRLRRGGSLRRRGREVDLEVKRRRRRRRLRPCGLRQLGRPARDRADGAGRGQALRRGRCLCREVNLDADGVGRARGGRRWLGRCRLGLRRGRRGSTHGRGRRRRRGRRVELELQVHEGRARGRSLLGRGSGRGATAARRPDGVDVARRDRAVVLGGLGTRAHGGSLERRPELVDPLVASTRVDRERALEDGLDLGPGPARPTRAASGGAPRRRCARIIASISPSIGGPPASTSTIVIARPQTSVHGPAARSASAPIAPARRSAA